MTGTAWHIENLRMSEEDKPRSKSKCRYYSNGKCEININCFGSKYCDHYKEKDSEVSFKSRKQETYKPPIDNLILYGSFKLQNTYTNERITYQIPNDFEEKDELVQIIIYRNVNSIFNYNGEQYKLLKKSLFFKKKKQKRNNQ